MATVIEDHQPLIGDSIVKGAPALMLVVEKFPWANTRRSQKKWISALAASVPACRAWRWTRHCSGRRLTWSWRSTTSFRSSSSALVLLLGAIFAFLLNWRTALITSVADRGIGHGGRQRCSTLKGVSLDLVTIAGLMLALSIIIDDALVDVGGYRTASTSGPSTREAKKSAATIVLEAAFETA